MRIAVSAQGNTLDALASPVFGRCLAFVFVDTETLDFEAVPNPAMNQGGGAGIQAAQFVVEHGAQAVLTGNLGPNAFDVLKAAGIAGYLVPEGTVRQAVEAFKAGRVQPLDSANTVAHTGMGAGRGPGQSMGQNGGSRPTTPRQAVPDPAREAELARLRETLKELRRQLAETMEKIERLEKES